MKNYISFCLTFIAWAAHLSAADRKELVCVKGVSSQQSFKKPPAWSFNWSLPKIHFYPFIKKTSNFLKDSRVFERDRVSPQERESLEGFIDQSIGELDERERVFPTYIAWGLYVVKNFSRTELEMINNLTALSFVSFVSWPLYRKQQSCEKESNRNKTVYKDSIASLSQKLSEDRQKIIQNSVLNECAEFLIDNSSELLDYDQSNYKLFYVIPEKALKRDNINKLINSIKNSEDHKIKYQKFLDRPESKNTDLSKTEIVQLGSIVLEILLPEVEEENKSIKTNMKNIIKETSKANLFKKLFIGSVLFNIYATLSGFWSNAFDFLYKRL